MRRFFQLHLRTTDVDAARAFYAAVLGDAALNIVELHEQAIARGARPHWLGYLDAGDVDRALATFVERGATPLNPKMVRPAGLELEAATLRDPGGAVVALARPLGPARAREGAKSGVDVVWFVLNTADVERAKASYGELFGWELKPPVDLAGVGVIHPFAWERGGAAVGAMSDIAARPGVHPHWLFHFRVEALEPAMDAVRAGGGLVIGPLTIPGGARIAVCDDPQGAAFALCEGSAGTATTMG
jgi:predicted enzyme related to lactoylglutathione lyase